MAILQTTKQVGLPTILFNPAMVRFVGINNASDTRMLVSQSLFPAIAATLPLPLVVLVTAVHPVAFDSECRLPPVVVLVPRPCLGMPTRAFCFV
jgi:hypothetical protein